MRLLSLTLVLLACGVWHVGVLSDVLRRLRERSDWCWPRFASVSLQFSSQHVQAGAVRQAVLCYTALTVTLRQAVLAQDIRQARDKTMIIYLRQLVFHQLELLILPLRKVIKRRALLKGALDTAVPELTAARLA